MTAGMLIQGGTLAATADDRTFTSLLVPFHEQATSNLGRFSTGPGVFELPEDLSTMTWNDSHDHEHPIASTTLLAEQADGIHATFRVAEGKRGDAMVADIKGGKRTAVSVEAADVVVENGRALSGRIFGAAIVAEGKRGAFPSARLVATAADDAVDDPDDPTTAHYTTMNVDPTTGSTYETETTVEEEESTDPDTGAQVLTRTTTEVMTITPGTPAEGSTPVPANQPAAPLLAARPSAASILGARNRAPKPKADQPAAKVDKRTLFAMLAAAAPSRMRGSGWDEKLLAELRSPRVSGSLYAASSDGVLTDITFDAAGSPADMIVPQWIGELWLGKTYSQRWIPLFHHNDLTSPTVKGWKWATLPTVAPYSGNKSNVPSGPVSTVPYDVEAQAFAGAHDVDRRYTDFNVSEFWDGYFAAMTASYAKQADLYTAAQLFATGATTPVAGGAVPANVNPVMAKLVDGALGIIDHGTPSFAVVSNADFRTLALTREQDNLALLNASLGLDGEAQLESFRVIPAGSQVTALNTGKVLVGDSNAASVYELPGSPIRIEGLDVSRGGIDPGLFGYCAFVVHQPLALALVSPYSGS